MSNKDEFPQGSPQRFAEDLYWRYSEFENLSVEEVKKCCYIALNMAASDVDTAMRLYYGEVKEIIKRRGL